MLLIAYDVAAAVISFALFVALVGPTFTDSVWAQSLESRDYAPLIVPSLEIALVAIVLAIPYSGWVARGTAHVVRRALLAGPFYGAAIVSAYSLAVTFLDGPPLVLGFVPAALFLTLPFWLVGGLLFGSLHGILARRFAHRSANAPIVV